MIETSSYSNLPQQSTMAEENYSPIEQLTGLYKQQMLDFIYATPHIPPTLFELKLRHIVVKNELLQKYSGEERLAEFDLPMLIDRQFPSMAMRTMKEHQMCQTGFVIGWKCNKTPIDNNLKDHETDDRF